MYDDYVKDGYIKPVKGGWQEWGNKNPKAIKALLDDYIYGGAGEKIKKSAPKKGMPFGL